MRSCRVRPSPGDCDSVRPEPGSARGESDRGVTQSLALQRHCLAKLFQERTLLVSSNHQLIPNYEINDFCLWGLSLGWAGLISCGRGIEATKYTEALFYLVQPKRGATPPGNDTLSPRRKGRSRWNVCKGKNGQLSNLMVLCWNPRPPTLGRLHVNDEI